MISCAHAAILPSLLTHASRSVPVNGSLSENTNPIPLYRPVASALSAWFTSVQVDGSFVLAGKCVFGLYGRFFSFFCSTVYFHTTN